MDPTITPEAVLTQLSSILNSDHFAGAFRIRKLLKFLVKETLAGRSAQIKGYTIALAVFGREADFDPQSDPIVRINSGRLRRYLDNYYKSCGPEATVRITIPKGTYVPSFSCFQPPPQDRNKLGRDACEALLGKEIGAERAAAGYTEPVIAVLPFMDLSSEETPVCLLDGFSDELNSLLALFEDIRVIDYYSMVK